MYARTYACPGTTDFFLFIYFHTEVRKAIRSMNLLSTFVFLFVSMCMCTCTRSVWLLQLFFSFVYCSVVSSSLPSHLVRLFSFYPIIIRSLTFSLLDHSTPILPRIPRFLSFLVALLRLSPSPLPRSFRVMKIIRRHVRVRGIERKVRRGGI